MLGKTAQLLTLCAGRRVDLRTSPVVEDVTGSTEVGNGGDHKQPSWKRAFRNPCISREPEIQKE